MKFKLTFLLLNDKESKTSLTLYRDSEVVALIQMKKKKKEVFIKTKWRKNNEVQRLRPGRRKKISKLAKTRLRFSALSQLNKREFIIKSVASAKQPSK